MHFGTKNSKYTYKMSLYELKETKSERNLGMIFSFDQKWNQQLLACSAKANAMLGLIKNAFVSFDLRMVRILYSVYVRPLIELAVPVWFPKK